MPELTNRMNQLPPYLFARIEARIASLKEEGVDVISLGIGDPDLPTPKFVREALSQAALDPKHHNYPSSSGEPWFRQAVVTWMKGRFGVDLDPNKQVCNVIGSKEGIANIARAYVGIGDIVLCPDPGYIVYANGSTILCDAIPEFLPLVEESGFLPDYSKIPEKSLSKAKIMYINYPNAPTGAVATPQFLKLTAEYATENDLLLIYDNAYSEFGFDGYHAPSILEYTDNALEFHSLSKTFCMTGDRIGFAVGKQEYIQALKTVKSNIDSGCPTYIQKAGVVALESYNGKKRPDEVEANMLQYALRRDVLLEGLQKIGLPTSKPKATFYVWTNISSTGLSSTEFCEKAIEKGVVLAPGNSFGPNGEGYVRFALTQPISRIKEAVERLSDITK